jgi:hypothetical protein
MKPLQNRDQTEQYPRGNSQLRCFIEHGYTARESVAEPRFDLCNLADA